MKPLLTKPEAIAAGEKFYFTGKACKRGHFSERWTYNSACVECNRTLNEKWREDNPIRLLQNQRQYAEVNREKRQAYMKSYRQENKEKLKAWSKQNYLARKETNRKIMQTACRKWRQANRSRMNALKRGYDARRLRATPSWLTKEDLQTMISVYKTAHELNHETGIKHHVDHIIPLRGKTVCGLHVPWNLQIIPAIQNLKKSNLLGHEK